jgi:hypothetical protein
MTLREIHRAVTSKKSVHRVQIYRYLRTLEISHIGARQRPQQYPPDTATRILCHLGLSAHIPAVQIGASPKKLITVAQLRAAKPKTKGTK